MINTVIYIVVNSNALCNDSLIILKRFSSYCTYLQNIKVTRYACLSLFYNGGFEKWKTESHFNLNPINCFDGTYIHLVVLSTVGKLCTEVKLFKAHTLLASTILLYFLHNVKKYRLNLHLHLRKDYNF